MRSGVNGLRKGLTARQRQALDHVAEGRADKEIAAALGISEAAAKKHVGSLRKRYGVASRSGVVFAAIAAGELSPPQAADPLPRKVMSGKVDP